jgi:hypothetical protein
MKLNLNTGYPDVETMYEDLLSIAIQVKKGQQQGKSQYGSWRVYSIETAEETKKRWEE